MSRIPPNQLPPDEWGPPVPPSPAGPQQAPPGPPAQWPSPPAPPARPGRSGLVAVAVIFAIAGLAVAMWAVIDNGSLDPDGEVSETAVADEADRTPEETVNMFFEAVFPPNCDALLDLVSQNFLTDAGQSRDEQVAACNELIVDPIPLEFLVEEIELVSQDGNRAIVAVTATTIDGTATEEVDLVMEDGEWKLDLSTGTVVDMPSNDLEDLGSGG